MDAAGFRTDVDATPDSLRTLAEALSAGRTGRVAPTLLAGVDAVLLLGMGSSGYAAGVVAARLRALGVRAVAELASSELLPPADPRQLVVAVSASGASVETVAAAARYAGGGRLVAVTEDASSPVTQGAHDVLPLLAGAEDGGVACRSYRHTLAVLLALADQLARGTAPDLAASCRSAADATERLLATAPDWVPPVADLLRGPDGCWVVAPAARWSSAQQSALMVREGPRRPAHAGETGDWSHVDVYLTKTLDYRLLLLPGSPYDAELLRWTAERGSTVVSVGPPVASGAASVPYEGSERPDVALLTETTVAELVAHHWWASA
jgi:glutamine---fructose-6-phosphate transaminase (isomerizing)